MPAGDSMRQLLSITAAVACAVACDDPATTITDARPADASASDGGGEGPLALPRTIDLGLGDCGGAATATVTVTNGGAADAELAFASSDPAFTITPSPVTIIAGTSTTFTVRAAVPATVNAGTTLTATLTATTNIPGHATETVTVTATSRGAMFAVSPPSINFGDVLVGEARTLSFVASNTGNGSMNLGIRALSNPDFTVTFGQDGVADLDPGELVNGTVRYQPTGTGGDDVAVPLELGGGAQCGVPPTTLRLSGSGATVGGVLVMGGPIDFGAVGCSAGPGTATLTLMNTGSTPRAFTATLPADPDGDDARFSVAPAGGTVPAGGTATLTVTRLAVARPVQPRVIDAVVRIAAGSAPVDVPVEMALRGPYLATSAAPTLDFGFQLAASRTDAPLPITNTGNLVATLTRSAPAPFAAVVPATIAAGGSGAGTLSYLPTAPAPASGTVTIDAPGACSSPVTVALVGGTGPYADISPAASFETCPPPAALATTLTVANPGTADLTITCAEDTTGGASGLAPTFTPPTATVLPGATATITVDHLPGPAHAGALTAALRCTTNEPLTNQRTTSLTRTLDGVDLALAAPAPLDFICFNNESRTFTTRNDGNTTAFVSPVEDLLFPLTLSFDFTPIAPGGETTHTISNGSGGPFRLPGGGDPCQLATGSGGVMFTGSVGVSSGSGTFCSVTPATLPVRLLDFLPSADAPGANARRR